MEEHTVVCVSFEDGHFFPRIIASTFKDFEKTVFFPQTAGTQRHDGMGLSLQFLGARDILAGYRLAKGVGLQKLYDEYGQAVSSFPVVRYDIF